MLFKRRKKLSWLTRQRAFWAPRKGWDRPYSYMYHRMKRLPASPHAIGAGIAAGIWVSFTPYIGFHLLLAMLVTLVLRGNLAAMIIGSVVGNPITFPIFWAMAYFLGAAIMGHANPNPILLQGDVTWRTITENPFEVLLPMSIGGNILGLVAGIASYYVVRSLVSSYQKHRRARLNKKRAQFLQKTQQDNTPQTEVSQSETSQELLGTQFKDHL